MGLSDYRVEAAMAVSELERAKRFYQDQLGLVPAEEEEQGVRYRCAENRHLRLSLAAERGHADDVDCGPAMAPSGGGSAEPSGPRLSKPGSTPPASTSSALRPPTCISVNLSVQATCTYLSEPPTRAGVSSACSTFSRCSAAATCEQSGTSRAAASATTW